MLTFDDSTPDQFALDANGNPRADTAVGVIQQVARENPGFRPTATFFVVKDIFGMDDAQASAGLKWLLQHGYDVGNHTQSHADLSVLPEKKVQDEIGGMEDRIARLAGGAHGDARLPVGSVPRKEKWAREPGGPVLLPGDLPRRVAAVTVAVQRGVRPLEHPEGTLGREDQGERLHQVLLDRVARALGQEPS